MIVSIFVAVLLFVHAGADCSSQFVLKVVGYQYLPDLAGDGLAGLASYIASRYYHDTGNCVQITYDTNLFALNTYDPASIVAALSTGGNYHLAEIDTITMQYFTPGASNSPIVPIPSGQDLDDFFRQSQIMVKNSAGVAFGYPTYSCANVLYSYHSGVGGLDSMEDLVSFVSYVKSLPGATEHRGWSSDITNPLDLRLEYIQGYLGSHENTPLYPAAYDPNNIDTSVISNLKTLRDNCVDSSDSTHNPCANCEYYNSPGSWFSDFASARNTVLLQGFPEYFSTIIATDPRNTDVTNPVAFPYSGFAIAGDGDRPYLFTDAFIISKSNCAGDTTCMSNVQSFLRWSKDNYAQIASLGLDLNPVRPRFLAVANREFWHSDEVLNLPFYGRDHYAKVLTSIMRGVGLETLHFWQNNTAQENVLLTDVYTGYSQYAAC